MPVSSYYGIYGHYQLYGIENSYQAVSEFGEGGLAFAALVLFGEINAQTGAELAAYGTMFGQPATVADLRPGAIGSLPTGLSDTGPDTLVELNDGQGVAPWLIKDTQTFVRLTDPADGLTSASQFSRIGDNVFYSSDGGETWVMPLDDSGTPAPQQLTNLNAPPFTAFPSSYTPTGGLLFFHVLGDETRNGLYVTDGTPAGTSRLLDIALPAISADIRVIAPTDALGAESSVIFSGDGELWRSDGTAAGTVLVKDIRQGVGASDPQGFTHIWGLDRHSYVFAANDGATGMEVHVTDGTEAGTTPLADINPGPPGSNPIFLGANNTFAFFAADDGVNGAQLWVTDGTGPGTRLVKVINPDGDAFSDFFNPAIVVDERLIFRATDGEHGQEVFISDGTEAGTGMIVDLNPGAPGSDPFNFTRANGAVLFEATADGSTYNLYQSLGTAETTDKLADSVWTPAGIAVLPATPLFFQSQATGQVVATVFQNDKHLGWSATTAPLGSEWEARAIGEVVAGITGPELFAQSNIDGRIIYTSFDSLGERQWDAVPGALTGWSLMGAGDFIGNERSEIVIRNQADGTHLLGQFDRAGLFDQWFAWTSPFKDVANNRDYQFVAAGDWNGDGIADGIFQNQLGSGDVFARSIINGIAQDFLVTDRITLDHRVTAVGDFDADGTADIVVQNQSTGEAVFKSSIFATDQWAPLLSSFAAGGVNVAAADIDQDGDSEIITEINGSFFAGHVGPPGIASWTLLANTGAGWEIVH